MSPEAAALELSVDAIQARLAQLGLTLGDAEDRNEDPTLPAGAPVEGSTPSAGLVISGAEAQDAEARDDSDVEDPSLLPDLGRPGR